MIGCFFGRKPQPEIAFLLRVLDCGDLMELAGLYGEARDRFNDRSLQDAVNKRMGEVIKLQNLGHSSLKAAQPDQGATR